MTNDHFTRTFRGPSWHALLSHEHYGPHFSVSGNHRLPTDEEVAAARRAIPESKGLVELVDRQVVNPYVRHFIPPAVARGRGAS